MGDKSREGPPPTRAPRHVRVGEVPDLLRPTTTTLLLPGLGPFTWQTPAHLGLLQPNKGHHAGAMLPVPIFVKKETTSTLGPLLFD